MTEEAIKVSLFPAGNTTFGDYDNDGRPDLFLTGPGHEGQIGLFHNEGDGRFADRTIDIHVDFV